MATKHSGTQVLSALAKSNKLVLTNKELAHALLEKFGGIEGLANHVRLEYESAGEGSMTRRAILSDMMRLIDKADPGANGQPLDQMSTDDIERELAARLAAARKAG